VRHRVGDGDEHPLVRLHLPAGGDLGVDADRPAVRAVVSVVVVVFAARAFFFGDPGRGELVWGQVADLVFLGRVDLVRACLRDVGEC